MSEKTKIAWCDSTLNWWEGCTKVSAGCAKCYAEARDKRFTGGAHWGKGAPRRKSKSAVKDALLFNRKPWVCDYCGKAFEIKQAHSCITPGDIRAAGDLKWHRRRIFSLSLGDWLDPEIPIEWLAEMLDTIRQCENVNWILCTKRPELWEQRIEKALEDAKELRWGIALVNWLARWLQGTPPNHVCLLASVENQDMAEARIPALLRIPARWRGLSCEPLLGPLDPTRVYWPDRDGGAKYEDALRDPISDYAKRHYPAARSLNVPRLSWLIIGGESGLNARPCNVNWIRSLVAQGKAAGVATFVKQMHDANGKLLKEMDQFPKDLQIQQFPFDK